MTDKTITQLLHDLRRGDHQALVGLTPLVYDSLRQLAGRMMRQERSNHTLQATAVVNECYLELVDMEVEWQDRARFLALAARQMRRILVDYARSNRRQKRGGDQRKLTLDENLAVDWAQNVDILELNDALVRLSEFDERKGQIVELHFFGGLTYEETAEALQISTATVDRDLRPAKAWLYRELVP